MSNQLDDLAKQVGASADPVKSLYDQGSASLEKMRELVTDRGPINERTDAFGKELMSLMGVIAKLQQTSVAPAVKRTADGLVAGFIAPAPDGHGYFAQRQSTVIGKVENAVAAQANALSRAAQNILDTPPVEPARFQPLSTAEAVVRYAGDFLPSWAGAISIDLMPAVLIFILCIVHSRIRQENDPAEGETMTAAQILTALRLVRELERAQPDGTVGLRHDRAPLQPAIDENVTALATARAGKKE